MIVIAGPCVIEDEVLVNEIADELKRQLGGLPVEFFFKASFDKANRTSIHGFRGPGLKNGLKILSDIKQRTGFRVLTDFHTVEQAEPVAEVADCIQVPAFLCRQTDMIVAAAEAAIKHGRKLNVKKGQFLAPWDVKNIIEKVSAVQTASQKPARPIGEWLYITERGSSFGYNSLVVDMTSFQTIQAYGVPVIFDATHSVQMPGAGPGGKSTGGRREYIEPLAKAAIAAGADGIFMECHPRPEEAKSDGPNAFYLQHVGGFVRQLQSISELIHKQEEI
ncbi:MAG: 3-deoxy-8-phosphooctulonate synthase [Bdellovibrionota bacterium]